MISVVRWHAAAKRERSGLNTTHVALLHEIWWVSSAVSFAGRTADGRADGCSLAALACSLAALALSLAPLALSLAGVPGLGPARRSLVAASAPRATTALGSSRGVGSMPNRSRIRAETRGIREDPPTR